jgi:class 3 adenylate cyclase
LRRITYISRFNRDFDHDSVLAIGRQSAKRNLELGVTGFLLYSDGVFFQVIEGDDVVVDDLFQRIRADSRHHDVLCLENRVGDFPREFADWSMEAIDLTEHTDLLMKPIRVLMKTLGGTLGILEKYSQPGVLRFLEQGIDPMTIPPERTRRLVVFTDIVGYSALASVLTPEETLDLVNSFVEATGSTLREHGAVADKLIGDSVMSSFDVDSADQALDFSLDLLRRLEQVRNAADQASPLSVLHAGIGIDAGLLVIGNVGTDSKLDFTLLGDVVNRASHLESLTRQMPRRLALSEAVKALTREPWEFDPLGEFDLKQAAGPTRAFSVNNPATERDASGGDDRAQILDFVRGRQSA